MGVNIRDHIVRYELLKVAGRDGTGVHGAVVDGLRVGQNNDHFFDALGKSAFNRLRNVNLLRPLLGADRVTVESIYDRVTASLFCPVAGR